MQKKKNNKLDYIKLKSFCTSKETIKTMEKQSMEWEKIFANHITDERLILKIYKERVQSTARKESA